MKSTKCSVCGLVGWSDYTEICKGCGSRLLPRSFESPYQAPFDSGTNPYGGPQLKKGLAISALVVGIISFLTLGLFGLGATLGVVLGIVAVVKASSNPSQYGGKGMAITGLILSAVSLVVIVPMGIIAAIAIPNLLAARIAANEGSAINAMQRISSAEATYQSIHEMYGTLEQLAADELLPAQLATGVRHGYVIKVTVVTRENPYPGFEATAVPADYPNSGRRSFFVDETGIIRATDARGGEATNLDSPMNAEENFSSTSPRRRRSDPELSY